jgi:hypothetical protein
VIGVVVLQSGMDLVKVELGSCSETCLTSGVDGNGAIGVEGERVIGMLEEEDQETAKFPVIKTEPKVTAYRVIRELPVLVTNIKSRE